MEHRGRLLSYEDNEADDVDDDADDSERQDDDRVDVDAANGRHLAQLVVTERVPGIIIENVELTYLEKSCSLHALDKINLVFI